VRRDPLHRISSSHCARQTVHLEDRGHASHRGPSSRWRFPRLPATLEWLYLRSCLMRQAAAEITLSSCLDFLLLTYTVFSMRMVPAGHRRLGRQQSSQASYRLMGRHRGPSKQPFEALRSRLSNRPVHPPLLNRLRTVQASPHRRRHLAPAARRSVRARLSRRLCQALRLKRHRRAQR